MTFIKMLDHLPKPTKRPMWRLNTADWEGYRENIRQQCIGKKVQMNVTEFTSLVISSATENIKKNSTTIPKKECRGGQANDRRYAERQHNRQRTQKTLIFF
jgi:hypothetical protein